MACGGTPRRLPPQAFQTALAAAFAPDNPCGFSLPHPARHVQAALCRATHCCEPLGWAAAARRGRVQRGAQEVVASEERCGLRRVCSRGARAKSRPVEFLPRPLAYAPGAPFQPSADAGVSRSRRRCRNSRSFAASICTIHSATSGAGAASPGTSESMEKLGIRPPGALPQAGDPGTSV
jgi:hypothetical protein